MPIVRTASAAIVILRSETILPRIAGIAGYYGFQVMQIFDSIISFDQCIGLVIGRIVAIEWYPYGAT